MSWPAPPACRGVGAAGRVGSGARRLRPGGRRAGRAWPSRCGSSRATPPCPAGTPSRCRPTWCWCAGSSATSARPTSGDRAALPSFCVPGAHVIWTRHRRPPDATPGIRADFAAAGFTEVAFEAPEGTVMTVGHNRFDGTIAPFDPGRRSSTSWATGSCRHDTQASRDGPRHPRTATSCDPASSRGTGSTPLSCRSMAWRTLREPARVVVPAIVIFGLDALQGTIFTEVAVDHLGLESVVRLRLRCLDAGPDLLQRHARAHGRAR